MSDVSSNITPNEDPERRSQAYHEAGHVVFGLMNGKRLLNVEIAIGENGKSGCAQWEPSSQLEGEVTEDEIKPDCVTLLAGHETEEFFAPNQNGWYASHFRDLAQVTLLFRRAPLASEEQFKTQWLLEIHETLRQPHVKNAIDAIAAQLIENGQVSGDEAFALFDRHFNPRGPKN